MRLKVLFHSTLIRLYSVSLPIKAGIVLRGVCPYLRVCVSVHPRRNSKTADQKV